MHFASVFEKISRIIPQEPALVCEAEVLPWPAYGAKVSPLIRKLDFTFITQMNTS